MAMTESKDGYLELLKQEGYITAGTQLFIREGLATQSSKTTKQDSTSPMTELKKAAGRIFASSPGTTVVLLSTAPFTHAHACTGRRLPALLDDLAQLCGPSVPVRKDYAQIRGNSARKTAVFIRGTGCLCSAASLYEAHALAMVIEKASLAKIGSSCLGSAKRISILEAYVMRLIYQHKYSKQAVSR